MRVGERLLPVDEEVLAEGACHGHAKIRGLERWMLPVLTHWLSRLWLGLITPVHARIGWVLVESLAHPTVAIVDPIGLAGSPPAFGARAIDGT